MAGMYQDMAAEMKRVMQICHEEGIEITVPYRNLFSLAYKNLVSNGRSSWRMLYTEKQKVEDKYIEDLHVIDELLQKVERELLSVCDEVLDIINRCALPNSESRPVHYRVFFLKMRGDYYRYKAEALEGEAEKEASNLALKSYLEAKEYAEGLSSTDPIRLGLYLNFSVFNYEILNNTEVACEIARTAFGAAIAELDNLSEEYYKDSTLIMQLLRDNLTLWSSKNDTNVCKNEESATDRRYG